MRILNIALLITGSLLIAFGPANAQAPVPQSNTQPIYTIRINVVERTMQAVNFQHRSGATKIDFEGTPLLPEARGEAKGVGSDDLNNLLSENRAMAVRNFLMDQGVAGTSIGSTGYGENRPVATNDTASGRQQNRRVELVVSGEAIGSPASRTQP